METDPELYTAREAAETFRTSAETVRRWAREGKIAAVTLPSGGRRFRRTDIEKLITPKVAS